MITIRVNKKCFRDVLFWTALKLVIGMIWFLISFRDVLFWTALKLQQHKKHGYGSFRDVLFWTALKLLNTLK